MKDSNILASLWLASCLLVVNGLSIGHSSAAQNLERRNETNDIRNQTLSFLNSTLNHSTDHDIEWWPWTGVIDGYRLSAEFSFAHKETHYLSEFEDLIDKCRNSYLDPEIAKVENSKRATTEWPNRRFDFEFKTYVRRRTISLQPARKEYTFTYKEVEIFGVLLQAWIGVLESKDYNVWFSPSRLVVQDIRIDRIVMKGDMVFDDFKPPPGGSGSDSGSGSISEV